MTLHLIARRWQYVLDLNEWQSKLGHDIQMEIPKGCYKEQQGYGTSERQVVGLWDAVVGKASARWWA